MKRRKKTNNKINIKKEKFITLLKNISLNNTIEECLIKIKNKNAIIEAVDLSNSIFVYSNIQILKSKVDKIEFGISNINTIIKFLNTISDTKIITEVNDNILLLERKDKRRSVSYLLKDPEVIPTVPDKKDTKDKIFNMQEYYVEIDSIFVKDLISYIGLLGQDSSKEVNIKYNHKKDNEIKFICGEKNENQFSLLLDHKVKKTENNNKGEINIIVNGDYLSKILNTIQFNEESSPLLYLGEEKPIVINDKQTFWALSPLVND